MSLLFSLLYVKFSTISCLLGRPVLSLKLSIYLHNMIYLPKIYGDCTGDMTPATSGSGKHVCQGTPALTVLRCQIFPFVRFGL